MTWLWVGRATEWLVPLVLIATTMFSVLHGELYTAIVTGTCAGFTAGLAIGRFVVVHAR